MFTWAERRKNEKSEFRAQFFQADGSLTPGFVKQRIRSPDTLFFYAQAGQNGCRRRRPFGLTDQMVRSLASVSLGGRRTRSGRSPQKASDSETRSRAHLRGINQSSFRTALHSASSLTLHTIRDILQLHANITLPLRLHPVGCLHALPLLCWPYLRPLSHCRGTSLKLRPP